MSDKKDNIENVIIGGVIGGVAGAILSDGDKRAIIISTIVGAAVGATIKASTESLAGDIPITVEEEGKLYKIYPNGDKEYIKDLPKDIYIGKKTFEFD